MAETLAEANKLLNATLADQLVRYSLVQELGEDIRVIVLPSGQDFILSESILGQTASVAVAAPP